MPLDHTALLPALPGSGARCRDGQDVHFCEDQSALCGEAPGLPVFRVQAAHTRAFRCCSRSRCPAQSWMEPVPLEVPISLEETPAPPAPGPGGPLAPGSPSPCFSLLFNHRERPSPRQKVTWPRGDRVHVQLRTWHLQSSLWPQPPRGPADQPRVPSLPGSRQVGACCSPGLQARVAQAGFCLPRPCWPPLLGPSRSTPGHTHPQHGAWAVPKPTGTPSSVCPQAAVIGPRARACVPLETSPGLERAWGC